MKRAPGTGHRNPAPPPGIASTCSEANDVRVRDAVGRGEGCRRSCRSFAAILPQRLAGAAPCATPVAAGRRGGTPRATRGGAGCRRRSCPPTMPLAAARAPGLRPYWAAIAGEGLAGLHDVAAGRLAAGRGGPRRSAGMTRVRPITMWFGVGDAVGRHDRRHGGPVASGDLGQRVPRLDRVARGTAAARRRGAVGDHQDLADVDPVRVGDGVGAHQGPPRCVPLRDAMPARVSPAFTVCRPASSSPPAAEQCDRGDDAERSLSSGVDGGTSRRRESPASAHAGGKVQQQHQQHQAQQSQ